MIDFWLVYTRHPPEDQKEEGESSISDFGGDLNLEPSSLMTIGTVTLLLIPPSGKPAAYITRTLNTFGPTSVVFSSSDHGGEHNMNEGHGRKAIGMGQSRKLRNGGVGSSGL